MFAISKPMYKSQVNKLVKNIKHASLHYKSNFIRLLQTNLLTNQICFAHFTTKTIRIWFMCFNVC